MKGGAARNTQLSQPHTHKCIIKSNLRYTSIYNRFLIRKLKLGLEEGRAPCEMGPDFNENIPKELETS